MEYQVENIKDESLNYPKELVVIPIAAPVFPCMIIPIILPGETFTEELEKNIFKLGYVGLNLIKKESKGKNRPKSIGPTPKASYEDIHQTGVLCKVIKNIRLPDGSINMLVHGLKRYKAMNIISSDPMVVESKILEEELELDKETDAYTRSVINQVKKLSELNPYFNEEMKLAMLNSSSPGALADLVAFSISLENFEAQDLLETLVVKKRFAKLLLFLQREKDVADIQKKISEEVNDKVNKYQREYFLKEQLKAIRNELGLEDDKYRDLKSMRAKLDKIVMPEDVKKIAKEELDRLEVIPESSPENNVARTYLNWIFDLPWSISSKEDIDIKAAKKILEEDHYGLDTAKQRILEFLAVRKLKPSYDGTILCLAGPPGVGKTSLGKSIARSLNRKFYRFSLGGMRDESEIKGHRRTYIGSMPGKILQALKRVGVNNPVIMLDEIDKISASNMGDPASALLEVLDPEQNKAFLDNYLDIPFDLSNVFFVATANYTNDIPSPLLDRMEVIELSGYSQEEKIVIANDWIIPKQISKHGLKSTHLKMDQSVLKKLISDYARGAGVRGLEEGIAKLCRKAALEFVAKKSNKFIVTEDKLEEYLGSPKYYSELASKQLPAGVVTGLAWTALGGEILFIETIPLKGKGAIKLTGQLGEVMSESANLAHSFIKRLVKTEDESFLAKYDVHLHIPAGATPKDGPSAGVAMALAIYGLATNLNIRSSLAMTGELSLTGRVLPVGGIKEKVLGAKRAGIKEIILPFKNKKDLKEVPLIHRKGIVFHFVEQFEDVLKIVKKK